MNIVFIGCVKFSDDSLKCLLNITGANIVGVITKRKSPFNADFISLEATAMKAQIPCFFADENSEESMYNWLRDRNADLVYCFGWSQILKKEILLLPKVGAIGFHPALLPQNRGRHPIIWALALGLEKTGSSFFFMDEGTDSGDLLSQKIIPIDLNDDADSLYKKITKVALEQISEFTQNFVSGKNITRKAQDNLKANFWRKRTKADGQIDWRMANRTIHNLVRALSKPYPGAHCIVNDADVKIWKTELVDEPVPSNIEAGKVLRIENRHIVTKCGVGAIRLLEHEFDELPKEGEYL